MEISNAKVIKSVFRNKDKIKKNEVIKKVKKPSYDLTPPGEKQYKLF